MQSTLPPIPTAPRHADATRTVSGVCHDRGAALAALDIPEGPGGEWRHEHRRLALQVWHQPLSVRPLRGPGGWRIVHHHASHILAPRDPGPEAA